MTLVVISQTFINVCASLSRPLITTLAHTGWSLNQVTTGSVHVTHFSRAGAVGFALKTASFISQLTTARK